ncbi:MAG: AAA family ATPase [Pseudomonadota bacterium]|nr:MAG: AAA family ATPase [Pseudomonadota bacterium]
MTFPPLTQMGRRICIIGPSNSGKSTLAHILGAKIGVPAVHLDQIRHIPGTDWQTRPLEDFLEDHARIIAEDGWVIDGNYSAAMADRLDRATGIIWIDPPLAGCIWRYLKRCFAGPEKRYGRLDNATREFSFDLIHYTLTRYPKNCEKYREHIAAHPDLPFISVKSMKELNRLYDSWGLKRP